MSRWLLLPPVLAIFACVTDAGTGPGEPDPAEDPSVTRAFGDGPLLFLERTLGAETVRLGLDTRWGGTIVDLSINGTEIVNAHDTGREIQVSFYDSTDQYDGFAGAGGTWGWNPVQGGDRWNAGSPTSEWWINGDSLYVRARPLEWFPDDKGGGDGDPVESDVIVEQWVVPVASHFRAFRVRYRLTHLAGDDHGSASHELPAVYANLEYDRLVHYGGSSPWIGSAVTFRSLMVLGTNLGPERRMSEHWAALVNDAGIGVTVYMPESMPFMNGFVALGEGGPDGDGTTYFSSTNPIAIGPYSVIDGEYYVIAGHYAEAREVIYAIRPSIVVRDILSPIGSLDEPQPDAVLSGTSSVAGWAWDLGGVVRVQILVDGVFVADAAYGVERRDVAIAYPGAPTGTGFEYRLDSTTLPDGPHLIGANAWDGAGHVLRLEALVQVRNQGK